MALMSCLLIVMNLITGAVGAGIIGAGPWLYSRVPGTCISFLHWPLIILGSIIVALSLAAIVGAYCRVSLFLWVYLLVMILLIAALLGFAIFSFVVTQKTVAKNIANVGYDKYRIGDYSMWLQNQVHDPKKWSKISACLADAGFCVGNYSTSLGVFYSQLSKGLRQLFAPLVTPCCLPPMACNYTISSTYDVTIHNYTADSDCTTFGNDFKVRCFQCNQCRAGVTDSIASDWRKVAIADSIAVGIFTIIYVIGCKTLRAI